MPSSLFTLAFKFSMTWLYHSIVSFNSLIITKRTYLDEISAGICVVGVKLDGFTTEPTLAQFNFLARQFEHGLPRSHLSFFFRQN